MNNQERDATLDRLRGFVTQQRTADETADAGSLDRAADIVALYEDRSWIKDVPAPKTRLNRGRPVDPESLSRFSKWLTAEVGLKGSTAYQLRDAHNLSSHYFRQAEIMPTGERELRPLKWLVKHEHTSAIPAVWARACEIAHGTPHSPDVRKALTEWKKEQGITGNRSATSAGGKGRGLVEKWLRDFHRLMDEYPELVIDAVNRVEEDAEQYFAAHEKAA